MPLSPQDILDRLDALGIAAETHDHPAVFTVEESRPLKQSIPGAHTKNLFLKDRKGRLFLVVALHDTAIDLKRLHETIGASGRVSFGSAELLRETLGVEPGSVTPFAAANDAAGLVTVVLDEGISAYGRANFHPLVNTMTTGISPDDLATFLRTTGHEPVVARLPGPLDPADAADCQATAQNPSR